MKARSAILVPVLLLSGCLEEDLLITLQPNGEGTLRIERTLGAEGEVAAAALARWEGVSAWSEITSATLADGRQQVRAVGYFRDVAELRRRAPAEGLSFQRERIPGALSLSVREELGPGAEDLLGGSDPDALVARRAQLSAALEGFRRRLTLVFPNEVDQAHGFARVEDDPTRLVHERTRASSLRVFDDLVSQVHGLVQRAKAKELAREAALKELSTLLDAARVQRARCEVKPGASTSRAFSEELAHATKAWASSPWREPVEAARVRLALPR